MAQLQCYFLGRNTLLQYVSVSLLLMLLLVLFFVVVASCLKVHVLRKMLRWLLYRGLVVLDLFYRKDISVWACHQKNNVGRGTSK